MGRGARAEHDARAHGPRDDDDDWHGGTIVANAAGTGTPGSDAGPGCSRNQEIGLGDRFDALVSSGAVRTEGVAAG